MSTEQKRIGRYDVVRLLGQGGMGTVYEVKVEGSTERLALKLLSNPDPGLAERFRREARALELLGRLDNVAKIRDAGEDRGRLFIVMELLPGGSLEDRVQDGPLEEREAARLLLPVAHAVHVMHELGVIHRDLKPHNVLFDARGRPVVTDLGIARNKRETSLTETGDMFGSVYYMAPEQANDTHDVDRRADVWALGAILYRIVTGSKVFQGTPTEVMRQVLFAKPVAARRMREGLSEEIEAICSRALARDRADRYPTAEAFAQDLERFVEGKPLLWATSAPRKERRSRAPLVLGVALAASLVANVVLALRAPKAAATNGERKEAPQPVAGVLVTARELAAASRATPEPTSPQERESRAHLAELALAIDERWVHVDCGQDEAGKLGAVLRGAARDVLLSSSPDPERIATARRRIVAARVLMPDAEPFVEEADALARLWEAKDTRLGTAARPWVHNGAYTVPAFKELRDQVRPGPPLEDREALVKFVLGVHRGLDQEVQNHPVLKGECYAEALLVYPRHPLLWSHVRDEASSVGDWPLAVRCSRIVLDETRRLLLPEEAVQKGFLGKFLFLCGREEEGVRLLDEGQSRGVDQYQGYDLAWARLAKNDLAGAKLALDRLDAIAPTDPHVRDAMAFLRGRIAVRER
jgi:predicted Ser/Thr protein kinase